MNKVQIYEDLIKEKLTLGPISKYQKYSKFPHKLIICGLLIVFTTIQVRLLSSYTSYDSRHLTYVLNNHIFNYYGWDPVYYSEDSPQMSINKFYSLPEIQESMKQLFQTMGNLNDIFFSKINQQKINTSINNLEVYYRNPYEDSLPQNYNFTIQNGFLNRKEQPFDIEDLHSLKGFLKQVKFITFQFNNIEIPTHFNDQEDITQQWVIQMSFDLEPIQFTQAQVYLYSKTFTLLHQRNHAEDQRIYIYSKFWFVHLSVLILAITSLILNLKQIYEALQIVIVARYKSIRVKQKPEKKEQQYINDMLSPAEWWSNEYDMRGEKRIKRIIERQIPWDQLSFNDKMLFFDMWSVLAIAGNVLQIIFTTTLLIGQVPFYYDSLQLIVGFSCCIAWISILKYLEFKQNIYLLTFLLKYSLPSLLKFLLGGLPFFIGYSILGLCLFYDISYFRNFRQSTMTLITLMYSNMVYEISYYSGQNLLSMIYVITFCIIFQLAFQNLFMTIFVSIVYDKFDAQNKQELIDYIQKHVPNINEMVRQSKRDLDDTFEKSPNAMIQSKKLTPLMTPTQTRRDQHLFKLNELTKKIINETQTLVRTVNSDVQIFTKKQKNVKKEIISKKLECLEFLNFKTQRISKRVDVLIQNYKL